MPVGSAWGLMGGTGRRPAAWLSGGPLPPQVMVGLCMLLAEIDADDAEG
jgi:hypothetical protein